VWLAGSDQRSQGFSCTSQGLQFPEKVKRLEYSQCQSKGSTSKVRKARRAVGALQVMHVRFVDCLHVSLAFALDIDIRVSSLSRLALLSTVRPHLHATPRS
jgi:hypothetical protein